MTLAFDTSANHDWFVDHSNAKHAVIAHNGCVIVDFDETLYLQNSTEDFIDGMKPRLVGKILLKILDLSKPWKLTGGDVTRDVWRLAAVLALAPWMLLSWARRSRALVARYTNVELREAIGSRQDVIVATNGFGFIVDVMLAHMGLGHLERVTCGG